jgi:hypothetical protein
MQQKLKKKRAPRRRRHQSAWLHIKGSALECNLTNLSQGGAEVVLKQDVDLPSHLAIVLVPNTPARMCELIWREGLTAGIKFLE